MTKVHSQIKETCIFCDWLQFCLQRLWMCNFDDWKHRCTWVIAPQQACAESCLWHWCTARWQLCVTWCVCVFCCCVMSSDSYTFYCDHCREMDSSKQACCTATQVQDFQGRLKKLAKIVWMHECCMWHAAWCINGAKSWGKEVKTPLICHNLRNLTVP